MTTRRQLSICFLTARRAPRFDWFFVGLKAQLRPDDRIEILIVDGFPRSQLQHDLAPGHRLALGATWPVQIVDIRVVHPKPTPWQGAHRVTSCDWWAKASAINTAIVLANGGYLAFVDDCSIPGPRWLEAVRQGARTREAVLAGTFDKVGAVMMPDHRLTASPDGKVNCGGAWLYGGTFALPRIWAFDVNGAEEGCDGMGGEDYIMGLMLENAGYRIDLSRDLWVTQERAELFTPEISTSGMRRLIKRGRQIHGVSPSDKARAAITRFGSRARTEFTPDLREIRIQQKACGDDLAWPMPDPDLRDWYDGALIRDADLTDIEAT